MSVITHGPLATRQSQGMSPQQKAAIGRIARRVGRVLLGAVLIVAAVSAVVGLKAFILLMRMPIHW